MESPKNILLLLIIIFVCYISACIISDYDIDTITASELQDCFKAYVTTNNPTELEIFPQVLGTWELDLNDQYKQVEFLLSGQYFVYDRNIILESGIFRIIEDKNIFVIKAIPESLNVNGIINICSNHIYNETTDKIWIKRW